MKGGLFQNIFKYLIQNTFFIGKFEVLFGAITAKVCGQVA